MTTDAEVASVARQYLRDFGRFFEVAFSPVTPTLRLPHPLVDASTLEVVNLEDNEKVEVTEYALHARNGLIKLKSAAPSTDYPNGLGINGTYFQWFLDEDLLFHASVVIAEHMHHRTDKTVEQIAGAEVEVLGVGALVSALWALLTELATDIDVASPEGLNIPAHQRYQQVQQLIMSWTAIYKEKAAMLNVGLYRIEQFELRRKSRLTNRLVPLYRAQELDDPRWPLRVRPAIDPIVENAEYDPSQWVALTNTSDGEGGNW